MKLILVLWNPDTASFPTLILNLRLQFLIDLLLLDKLELKILIVLL
jgi:hypothetical protein